MHVKNSHGKLEAEIKKMNVNAGLVLGDVAYFKFLIAEAFIYATLQQAHGE